MPTDAFFRRPLKEPLIVGGTRSTARVRIATLGSGLPGGSYIFLAKVIVVTRVDERGRDSAFAQFWLEAGGAVDQAWTTLWHASDPGSLQPADTVSLQLAATIKGPTRRGAPRVQLFCRSRAGILELQDLVITAIRVDPLKELSS